MQTVLLTGGTGLIGTALAKALVNKGYKVVIATRQKQATSSNSNVQYTYWNIEKQVIDKETISATDYIIHLAGAGVADKRWTKKRKQEIVDSRVQSGKLIVNSLQTIPNKVKAVISASAIGWYGPDAIVSNPNPFTEKAIANTDFLGDACKQWEESLAPVENSKCRLVKLRIGIVLSKEGGALTEFRKPLKFGVASILGSGKQVISWIHIDDLVAMYMYAIENEKIVGVYNAVAPNPVTNKKLVLTLARLFQKFYIPVHVPSFILKIIMGEMSIEVLKSTTVSSKKIQEEDFIFKFATIETAIKEVAN